MTVVLDGSGLTVEKVVRIARQAEPVELQTTLVGTEDGTDCCWTADRRAGTDR